MNNQKKTFKRQKVILYAYNRRNVGDDCMIQLICNRYPHIKFILISENKTYKFYPFPNNLKIVSYRKLRYRLLNTIGYHLFAAIELFHKHKNSDYNKNKKIYLDIVEEIYSKNSLCQIMVGGSIFLQTPTWKINYKKQMKRAIKNNLYIIGCNFGKYYHDVFKNKYHKLFSKCQDVCFRDEFSYDLFKDIASARCGSDLLFSYDFNNNVYSKKGIYNRLYKLLNHNKIRENKKLYQNHKIALISVVNIDNKLSLYAKNNKLSKKDLYYNLIKKEILIAIERGCTPCLAAFCGYEGDNIAVDEIYSLLDDSIKKHVIKYYYNGNLKEIISIIKQSKYIVATRMHCMIFGMLFNKEIKTIIYDNKQEYILKDMKIIDAKEQNCILKVIQIVPDKRMISVQKEKSEQQFKKLDKKLKFIK